MLKTRLFSAVAFLFVCAISNTFAGFPASPASENPSWVNNPILMSSEGRATGDSENVTLIGRWANGPCFAVDVQNDIAYLGAFGRTPVR